MLRQIFQLYRAHFGGLFAVSCLALLPNALINLYYAAQCPRLGDYSALLQQPPALAVLALAGFFSLAVCTAAEAVILRFVGGVYLKKPVSWFQVPGRIGGGWAALAGNQIVMLAAYGVALLPSILCGCLAYRAGQTLQLGAFVGWSFASVAALCPVVILYVWFWFAGTSVLLENTGILSSLQRSLVLARHSGRGFWEWSGTRISLLLLTFLAAAVLLENLASLADWGKPSMPMLAVPDILQKTLEAKSLAPLWHEIARLPIPVTPLSQILNSLAYALILPLVPLSRVILFEDIKAQRGEPLSRLG
jgi:hypothetical protein